MQVHIDLKATDADPAERSRELSQASEHGGRKWKTQRCDGSERRRMREATTHVDGKRGRHCGKRCWWKCE